LGPAVHSALQLGLALAQEIDGEPVVSGPVLLLALLQHDCDLRLKLEAKGLDVQRLEQAARTGSEPYTELDEPICLPEPTDQIDAARILDANLNRAREALRVVEDYCRFALDDAFLSGELKRLRHDLAAASESLSPGLLISSRDTGRDVGTEISTEREGRRTSSLEVAQVNCKRFQEALRSMEEYGKLHGPCPGRSFKGLRYRAYTLERALVLTAQSCQRLRDARLYVLVTGSSCTAALDWTIREAAAGGADVIQLREKELSDRQLLERAHHVRRWSREAGIIFIVNDRPDIARLVSADGVHLGQDDLPVKEARRILGPDALIGVSTHDIHQVRKAALDGANYIGVGPAFPSPTKAFTELPGPSFVVEAVRETALPAFVLGGVNLETIDAAVAAGARRVAVSAAICQADDPRAAAAELRRRLRDGSAAPGSPR
jgi:thiamine-phosphate pyrophosphorylase